MSSNIKVTNDDIADILCTAFEGGINHWCEGVTCDNDDVPYSYYSDILAYTDNALMLSVVEEVEKYELTKEKLINGICNAYKDGYFADYEWVRNGEVDVFNIDAEVADVIVQMAIFENVVYG